MRAATPRSRTIRRSSSTTSTAGRSRAPSPVLQEPYRAGRFHLRSAVHQPSAGPSSHSPEAQAGAHHVRQLRPRRSTTDARPTYRSLRAFQGHVRQGGVDRPGEKIDHIAGSSSAPENLQLLCAPCHREKTDAAFVPGPPDKVEWLQKIFRERVQPQHPVRWCDTTSEDQTPEGPWAYACRSRKSERRQRLLARLHRAHGLRPSGFPKRTKTWEMWELAEAPELKTRTPTRTPPTTSGLDPTSSTSCRRTIDRPSPPSPGNIPLLSSCKFCLREREWYESNELVHSWRWRVETLIVDHGLCGGEPGTSSDRQKPADHRAES